MNHFLNILESKLLPIAPYTNSISSYTGYDTIKLRNMCPNNRCMNYNIYGTITVRNSDMRIEERRPEVSLKVKKLAIISEISFFLNQLIV